MGYRNSGNVLVITKSVEIKNLFRQIDQCYCRFNIRTISTLQPQAKKSGIKVIFLDIDIFRNAKGLNRKPFQNKRLIFTFVQELKDKYLGIPIFVIMGKAPENSKVEKKGRVSRNVYYKNIQELISYGIEFVLAKPLNEITIEGILFRHIVNLRDRLASYNFKKYHGIYLNERSHYVIFNDCKIFLSETETALLSLLMKEERYLRCEDIKRGLENKTDKTYKTESVRIYVQRIREKFVTCTGINVIGNKYGRGYYITV
jgi:hypothetical protein